MAKNEITISPQTKKILEYFAKVNPSLMFKTGNVQRTISPREDVHIKALFPEKVPQEFGIYDISKFLSILSMYDSPTITIGDKALTIKGADGKKFSYTLCTDNMVFSPDDSEMDFPEAIVEFDIPSENLQFAIKQIAIAKLPHFSFNSDGKNVYIVGYNAKDTTGDKFFEKIADCKEIFNVIFNTDKIANIMENKYKVKIYNGMVQFISDVIEYAIAPEAESKYE